MGPGEARPDGRVTPALTSSVVSIACRLPCRSASRVGTFVSTCPLSNAGRGAGATGGVIVPPVLVSVVLGPRVRVSLQV